MEVSQGGWVVGGSVFRHGWQAPGRRAGGSGRGWRWGRWEIRGPHGRPLSAPLCWLESEARVEVGVSTRDPRDPRTRPAQVLEAQGLAGTPCRLRGAAPRHVLLTRDGWGAQLHSLRGHPPGGQALRGTGAGGRQAAGSSLARPPQIRQ